MLIITTSFRLLKVGGKPLELFYAAKIHKKNDISK